MSPGDLKKCTLFGSSFWEFDSVDLLGAPGVNIIANTQVILMQSVETAKSNDHIEWSAGNFYSIFTTAICKTSINTTSETENKGAHWLWLFF